ncbi:MAG: alkaline phosphatase family protein, partial [Actinobacteria bacterium]
MSQPRKLCLIVVDSLRTDMLLRAVADDLAPNFGGLLERGTLIGDCVSAFPSVTPVACSEIATGAGADRHHISGMNWYHRAERRYVEYGSSWEATRAFGLFRTLYDTVYNMNMAHLSHEVETIFERLGDAGVRTACTPFLIYRGRRRHELSLEGLMRRVAVAADFRHAVWGPDELFYGDLYASRRVPCKPTLRPGTRDAYSGCVSRELIADDGYDFLLFSLPDNDHHTHTYGVDAMRDSISHADHSFGELVDAAGGIDEFCDSHAVILMADHAQTDVQHEVPIAAALEVEWHVLGPNSERPELAQLAVSPTARAAGVYVLAQGRRRRQMLEAVLAQLRDLE